MSTLSDADRERIIRAHETAVLRGRGLELAANLGRKGRIDAYNEAESTFASLLAELGEGKTDREEVMPNSSETKHSRGQRSAPGDTATPPATVSAPGAGADKVLKSTSRGAGWHPTEPSGDGPEAQPLPPSVSEKDALGRQWKEPLYSHQRELLTAPGNIVEAAPDQCSPPEQRSAEPAQDWLDHMGTDVDGALKRDGLSGEPAQNRDAMSSPAIAPLVEGAQKAIDLMAKCHGAHALEHASAADPSGVVLYFDTPADAAAFLDWCTYISDASALGCGQLSVPIARLGPGNSEAGGASDYSQKRIKELEDALRKYGGHDVSCSGFGFGYCKCGLDAALSQSPRE